MQVFTTTITFTGTGAQTIPDLASNGFKASILTVAPAEANSHVSYCASAGFVIGSIPTGIIKQLQIPSAILAGNIPLDQFQVQDPKGANPIDLTQYSFDGTSGEKLNVTIHVY